MKAADHLKQFAAGLSMAWRRDRRLQRADVAEKLAAAIRLIDEARRCLLVNPNAGWDDGHEPIFPLVLGVRDTERGLVDDAVERAADLVRARGYEPPRPSQLLALICIDFLMTNTFGRTGDLAARKHFLAKMEHHLQMKLIGIEGGRPVYGLHTLLRLAGEDA